MAWIESHQELGQHPKTRKLAHLLGISRVTAIGHLHCLWWWAIDYASDGDLSRFDALDIAFGMEWEGDPDKLIEALVAAEFLDCGEAEVLTIHDWEDYGGKLIRRRKANTNRMRAARDKDEQDTCSARAEHVQRTPDARAAHVRNTCSARVKRENSTEEDRTGEDRGESPLTPLAGAGAPDATEQPGESPKKSSRRKSAVPIPNDFTLTADRLAMAADAGLDEAAARHEFRKFCAHATATDRRMVDWDATWRTWTLKAIEDRHHSRAPASPAGRAGSQLQSQDELRRRIAEAEAQEARAP